MVVANNMHHRESREKRQNRWRRPDSGTTDLNSFDSLPGLAVTLGLCHVGSPRFLVNCRRSSNSEVPSMKSTLRDSPCRKPTPPDTSPLQAMPLMECMLIECMLGRRPTLSPQGYMYHRILYRPWLCWTYTITFRYLDPQGSDFRRILRSSVRFH